MIDIYIIYLFILFICVYYIIIFKVYVKKAFKRFYCMASVDRVKCKSECM